MRSIINILAVILIVFGIGALAYNGFTYTKREKIVEIGSLEVTADEQKTVYFSPVLGGLSLAVGIVLVIIGRVGRKD